MTFSIEQKKSETINIDSLDWGGLRSCVICAAHWWCFKPLSFFVFLTANRQFEVKVDLCVQYIVIEALECFSSVTIWQEHLFCEEGPAGEAKRKRRSDANSARYGYLLLTTITSVAANNYILHSTLSYSMVVVYIRVEWLLFKPLYHFVEQSSRKTVRRFKFLHLASNFYAALCSALQHSSYLLRVSARCLCVHAPRSLVSFPNFLGSVWRILWCKKFTQPVVQPLPSQIGQHLVASFTYRSNELLADEPKAAQL